MRNEFLLSALLLATLCTAHAQDNEEVPDGKSKIEAIPGSEMTLEGRQNLPKGFRGDSLWSLIDKIEHVEKSSQDEFTKTDERNAQLATLRAKPYKFVISPELNAMLDNNYNRISGTRYDADAEVMKVNLWVENHSSSLLSPDYTTIVVAETTKNTNYIGQNAYGAKAKISSILVNQVGLAFANIKQQNNTALFSFSFPIKPREAKALKDNLAFYVDVELTGSEAFKGDILKTVGGDKATITNPLEFYWSGRYVLANVKEVGIYKKSTGEVLKWKAFDN